MKQAAEMSNNSENLNIVWLIIFTIIEIIVNMTKYAHHHNKKINPSNTNSCNKYGQTHEEKQC